MSINIGPEIQDFWDAFVAESGLKYLKDKKIDAWSFGNTKEMGDDLCALVKEGKKTATCSLLRAYDGDEAEIPQVGLYSVICDGSERPQCIVFLIHTWICRFNEVTAEHAYEEGEGDRSLAYWREAHLEFFSQYEGFTVEDLLVCERFKVVYK